MRTAPRPRTTAGALTAAAIIAGNLCGCANTGSSSAGTSTCQLADKYTFVTTTGQGTCTAAGAELAAIDGEYWSSALTNTITQGESCSFPGITVWGQGDIDGQMICSQIQQNGGHL